MSRRRSLALFGYGNAGGGYNTVSARVHGCESLDGSRCSWLVDTEPRRGGYPDQVVVW